MDWNEVKFWLDCHGHINEQWDCIAIGVDGDNIYCEDSMENTFISIFTRGDGELIVYVGMLHPKMSVGGPTGVYVESHFDVIDYLVDHMENMYDELMRKVVG